MKKWQSVLRGLGGKTIELIHPGHGETKNREFVITRTWEEAIGNFECLN